MNSVAGPFNQQSNIDIRPSARARTHTHAPEGFSGGSVLTGCSRSGKITFEDGIS